MRQSYQNEKMIVMKEKVYAILSLISIALFAQIITFGQTNIEGGTSKLTQPGSPVGSYSISGFESVNLFNGNLNFNLPLAKVGGRGKANTSINLMLDSAKWDIKKIDPLRSTESELFDAYYRGFGDQITASNSLQILQQGLEQSLSNLRMTLCQETMGWYQQHGDPIPLTTVPQGLENYPELRPTFSYSIIPPAECNPGFASIQAEIEASLNAGGGTLAGPIIGDSNLTHYKFSTTTNEIKAGYGPGIVVARIGYTGKLAPTFPNPMSYDSLNTLTRIYFLAPDGTEHELRDVLTDGEPIAQFQGRTHNRGKIFTSPDGSRVRFVADLDITDDLVVNGTPRKLSVTSMNANEDTYGFYPSGMLYFPDGTKYKIVNGKVEWIRDVDGNQTDFLYGSGGLTKATDSMGREVNITYNNPTNQPDTTYDAISTQIGQNQ